MGRVVFPQQQQCEPADTAVVYLHTSYLLIYLFFIADNDSGALNTDILAYIVISMDIYICHVYIHT